MTRIWMAGAASLMVAGCTLPPEDTTPEDLALFDSAVASIGCDLTDESDYLPVELQTGLSRTKVQEVAAYRVELQEAVMLSNGGVRLMTGACAPEEEAVPEVASAT